MVKYYLHTMNGEPAGFGEEDKMIFFAQRGKGWGAPLVKDLKTIRKQQKISKKTRGEEHNNFEHDYVVVEVE